jgi:hypothetical protein
MRKIWTLEKLKIEALKYKNRSSFQKGSRGAYFAAAKNKLLEQICSHMPRRLDQSSKNHPMFKWTDEVLKQEALKYKTKSEFKNKSPKQYKSAYRRNILDAICTHMPKRVIKCGEDNASFKWTYEMLKLEALKYNTKDEFRKKSNGAYQTGKKRGLLDDICPHMPKFNRKRGEQHYCFKWTNEMLQDEALKYNTRSDFQKNSRKAYDIAHKRKILDSICSHMKASGNSSKPELELFDIIKAIYPKAQKLRVAAKRNQSLVEGKPHIHGFDIDIYIPELRKGLEHNGRYWHSVEGLARSRENWPLEDLINYNQIKSDYFLNKHGISILHIDGEDWKNNREDCIKRCLEFLNTEQKKVA